MHISTELTLDIHKAHAALVGSTLQLVLALTALAAALVSLAVSAWVSLRPRPDSPAELLSTVRQLSLDVTELYDKVEHWQRRDRVRRLREGQEKAAADPELADLGGQRAHDVDGALSKAQLRELVFGGR